MSDISKDDQEYTSTSPTSNGDFQSREYSHGVENVDEGLKELGWLSRRLRRLGTFSALNVLLTLGFVVAAGVMRAFPIISELRIGVVVSGIALAFQGFYLLFLWERRVDFGMVLYEEISDEFEWRHRSYRPKSNQDASEPNTKRERPEFKIRVALREFLKSTKLPLTPDRVGSSGYMVIYVLCVLALLVLIPIYYN